MAWWVNPSSNCNLNRVPAIWIPSNIFRKRSYPKRNLVHSPLETLVTERNFPFCHVLWMDQGNVMKSFVPHKSRKLARVPFIGGPSELVSQVKSSYPHFFTICEIQIPSHCSCPVPLLVVYHFIQLFPGNDFCIPTETTVDQVIRLVLIPEIPRGLLLLVLTQLILLDLQLLRRLR